MQVLVSLKTDWIQEAWNSNFQAESLGIKLCEAVRKNLNGVLAFLNRIIAFLFANVALFYQV